MKQTGEPGNGLRVLTLVTDSSTRDPTSQHKIEELFEQRRSIIHPLLPQILDLHLHGRLPGLVTPRIERPRLPETLGRWTLEERINAALELSRLLDFAHQKRTLWGWLNPGRIFCDPDRIEFVNHVIPGEFLSRIDPSPRSYRYCAPEVLRNQRATLPGDLYTLGMLLYFIFTGCEPFCDSLPGQVGEKQRAVMPTLPGRIRPNLPGFVDTVIMNLVQKVPADRIPLREVIGILESRGRCCRPRPPVLTSRLVGRKEELSRATNAVEEFHQSRTPILLVLTGVAGIGKTRLLDQVELRGKILGLPVFHIPHDPRDHPLERFKALVRELEGDGTGDARVAEGSAGNCSPETALYESVVQLCTRTPILLRPSNLHWMDKESLSVYRQLILNRENPVMVLAERRLDDRFLEFRKLESDAAKAGRLRTVNLSPMSNAEAQQMLGNLLPGVLSERLRSRIIETASGNPLHLLELIALFRRRGTLRYGSRGWSPLIPDEHPWPPPPEIAESVRLRLSGLPPPQMEFLHALALLDRPVSLGLLARRTRLHRVFSLDTAFELERRGFVQINGGFKDPMIRLESRWVGAAIRQDMPEPTRKKVHRRIFQILTEGPGNGSREPEEIARHAVRAGLETAARRLAGNVVDHPERSGTLSRAICLHQSSKAKNAAQGLEWQQIETHLDFLFRSGQFEQCEQLVRDLMSQAERSDHLSSLRLLLGRLMLQREDLDGATEIFEKLCATQTSAPVAELAGACLLECHSRTGRMRRARKLASLTIAVRSRRDDGLVAAQKYRALSSFFSGSGLYAEALPWRLRTIRSLYQRDLPGHISAELLEMAQAQLLAAKPGSAGRIAGEAFHLAEQVACQDQLVKVILFQARLLRLSGRHWEAERLLQPLIHPGFEGSPSGRIRDEIRTGALRELARNSCDRLLLELALRRLKEASRNGEGRHPAVQLDEALILARIHCLLGDPGRGIELAEQALQKGSLDQVIRSHLVCAMAFRSIDDLDAAESHLKAGLGQVPSQFCYYRALFRIGQSKTALARGQLHQAAALIRDSDVERVRSEFSPVYQECLILDGEIASRRGHIRRAKAISARALLNGRATERPALRAAVLATVAMTEARAGNFPVAESRFQRATGILTGLKSLLSPEHRAGFERAQIVPMKNRVQTELRPLHPTKNPQLMVALGRFFESLNRLRGEEACFKKLLECVKDQFPFSGARLHLANSTGFPGPCVAAQDSVRTDYQEWLEGVPNDPPIHVESNQKVVSISIALDKGGRTRGWLYLERPGSLLPELDFDLLSVLKGIIVQLLEKPQPVNSPAVITAPRRGVPGDSGFVGKHPLVTDLLSKAAKFSKTSSTVLLVGESGTGKELLARMIHDSSGLTGPFVPVSCATFSPDLIESQLFGHARGAFTGAIGDRTGFFEAASRGTLFLDEISAMPIALQPALLRVLQERAITRVGETYERTIDARIVVATNRDLVELCTEKEFRLDLYHRLNVLRLDIPPLRERTSDIPLLCNHFLSQLEREFGLRASLTPSALVLLQEYSFPGNVRELKNLLEKLAYASPYGRIGRAEIESELDGPGLRCRVSTSPHLKQLFNDLESGKTNFWRGVRDPFLQRRLSRAEVRQIVSAGLEKCGGSYRKLTRFFGLGDEDYKRFLGFLSNHGCKVDFRPYRSR